MAGKTIVLLFVKAPERGKVKSRLAAVVGDGAALEIYKNLAASILETLNAGRHAFRICFFPPNAKEKITRWLGNDYDYLPQQGKDLGLRMKNAFIQVFSEGMERALIIGSDIPQLTNSVIDEAFESLKSNDAVIGPAFDGGYYLIGFNRRSFLPGAFSGMAWGTDTVCERTAGILENAGRRVRLLPRLRDIDTIADLKTFAGENPSVKFGACSIIRFLHEREDMLI